MYNSDNFLETRKKDQKAVAEFMAIYNPWRAKIQSSRPKKLCTAIIKCNGECKLTINQYAGVGKIGTVYFEKEFSGLDEFVLWLKSDPMPEFVAKETTSKVGDLFFNPTPEEVNPDYIKALDQNTLDKVVVDLFFKDTSRGVYQRVHRQTGLPTSRIAEIINRHVRANGNK